MRVLITGASGAIGGQLVQALLSEGDTVRVLARRTSDVKNIKSSNIELSYGDVTDPESIGQPLENVDFVYHLAAIVPPRLWRVPRNVVWNVNCQGTLNLLEACRGKEVKRFVYASTVGVMGYVDRGRADESHPYNPQGLYERTKCEAEKLVLEYNREYGVPIAVIRIPAVYGPGLIHGMVELFQAVQNHRFRFLGNGESLIHLIYIEDLIEAFLLLRRQDKGLREIYIVGMKDPVTWREYVKTIAEVMGVDPPNGHVPVWLANMLGLFSEILLRPFSKNEPYLVRYRVDWTTKNSSFDVSKAIKELGFEPKTSLREGVKKTVEWYRKYGYLA
jgi:nucleoside-diphosphate-sugar epimerase